MKVASDRPRSACEQNWHLAPGLFVATWHNVGVYRTNDSVKMDFQMILTIPLGCGAGDFDVEFRYNRCEWEAGAASGDTNGNGLCEASEPTCTPAQAGGVRRGQQRGLRGDPGVANRGHPERLHHLQRRDARHLALQRPRRRGQLPGHG